jgi:nucleotide-binding universal stress UspA family protein
MYKRVLVPLDGSALAEAILPFVEQVAGPLGAEVILLRVVEPVSAAGAIATAGVVPPTAYALSELEAKRYLVKAEPRLVKKGLRVRTRIALGPPADAILGAIHTSGADLVAMTTHGRSGLGRALFGSVAESVLRASPVPVLLVRAPARRKSKARERDPAEYD